MFDQSHNVELSQKDLALISSALETQRKILQVQASAGGKTAHARLNETKRVIAQVAAHEPGNGGCKSNFLARLGMLFGGAATHHG